MPSIDSDEHRPDAGAGVEAVAGGSGAATRAPGVGVVADPFCFRRSEANHIEEWKNFITTCIINFPGGRTNRSLPHTNHLPTSTRNGPPSPLPPDFFQSTRTSCPRYQSVQSGQHIRDPSRQRRATTRPQLAQAAPPGIQSYIGSTGSVDDVVFGSGGSSGSPFSSPAVPGGPAPVGADSSSASSSPAESVRNVSRFPSRIPPLLAART